jgi:hypothetical protein
MSIPLETTSSILNSLDVSMHCMSYLLTLAHFFLGFSFCRLQRLLYDSRLNTVRTKPLNVCSHSFSHSHSHSFFSSSSSRLCLSITFSRSMCYAHKEAIRCTKLSVNWKPCMLFLSSCLLCFAVCLLAFLILIVVLFLLVCSFAVISFSLLDFGLLHSSLARTCGMLTSKQLIVRSCQ